MRTSGQRRILGVRRCIRTCRRAWLAVAIPGAGRGRGGARKRERRTAGLRAETRLSRAAGDPTHGVRILIIAIHGANREVALRQLELQIGSSHHGPDPGSDAIRGPQLVLPSLRASGFYLKKTAPLIIWAAPRP